MSRFTVSGGKRPTLLDFLCEQLGTSRKKAKAVLDRRDAFVNRRRVWMAKHPLRPGDIVEVMNAGSTSVPRPATASPEILHRDEHMVVVNKRPGIETCGKNGLEGLVARAMAPQPVFPVHRLDTDTSGCVLFALTHGALDALTDQFRRRALHKQYHAIAEGRIAGGVTLREPLSGLTSVTHVEVIDTCSRASHLLLKPETGRTHQIRRHLSGIGHPVLGDKQYATGRDTSEAHRLVARQMLHASGLEFVHPITGGKMHVRASLPTDFKACLRALGLR